MMLAEIAELKKQQAAHQNEDGRIEIDSISQFSMSTIFTKGTAR